MEQKSNQLPIPDFVEKARKRLMNGSDDKMNECVNFVAKRVVANAKNWIPYHVEQAANNGKNVSVTKSYIDIGGSDVCLWSRNKLIQRERILRVLDIVKNNNTLQEEFKFPIDVDYKKSESYRRGTLEAIKFTCNYTKNLL